MQATATLPHADTHVGHPSHHDAGFWRSYVFTVDHKVIGMQYGLTALGFLLFGFTLMIMMRWQMAHPGEPIPLVGPLLATVLGDVAAKGIMSPDLYNSFG